MKVASVILAIALTFAVAGCGSTEKAKTVTATPEVKTSAKPPVQPTMAVAVESLYKKNTKMFANGCADLKLKGLKGLESQLVKIGPTGYSGHKADELAAATVDYLNAHCP